jgi:MFS family permease
VGRFAGAALAGRLRGFAAPARWFVAACALLGVGLAAMGFAPSVIALIPIALTTGVGNGVLNVALGGLIMGRAAAAERGRVAAMLTGTASGVQLAAFATGGALAGTLGPREVFVLADCLGLLAPVLLGRRLVRAADWAACPIPTSPPSVGDSPPPAASPMPSLAT